MGDPGSRRWLGVAMLAGATYCVLGFASAALANQATTPSVRFIWRLSAFAGSAVVLVAHVAYEHFRLANPARPATWHASLGAALGGFGLALAANLHDLGSAAGYRPRMLVALVAWPLLTAVPASIVAIIVAVVLGGGRRRA